MKRILLIPFALAALLEPIHAHAQMVTVSYDTFMQQDENARRAQFQQLTAENKAALQREQIVRWRRVNAYRLTPEQDQLLADTAAFIRPDFYERRRKDDETIARFMALERRTSEAFPSGESSLNLFAGPYLPPQP